MRKSPQKAERFEPFRDDKARKGETLRMFTRFFPRIDNDVSAEMFDELWKMKIRSAEELFLCSFRGAEADGQRC